MSTHDSPPAEPSPAPAPIRPRKRPRKPTRKARRSNADYRWTIPKVQAFLEALSQCGRVAEAARAVGMSRQAAYKLRARLDGPKFQAAFENARKAGILARAEASRARMEAGRSRWEGPGIAALDYLRASPVRPQIDGRAAQGGGSVLQGDTRPAQTDAGAAHGDGSARKATQHRPDRVTPGPRPAPPPVRPPPSGAAATLMRSGESAAPEARSIVQGAQTITGGNTMQFQFNSDSSVMGTQDIATRMEGQVRERLSRFEDRLTRLEVHVRDENGSKHGPNDKACTIEARPKGGKPIGVTERSDDLDAAVRSAAGTLAQRLDRHFGKQTRHAHDARPEKAI